MNLWELTAPCHFGTEAVLKREILDLGYEVTRVEDGRVTFEADAQGVADANLFLRTTERVLLKVGEVKAEQIPCGIYSSLFLITEANKLLYKTRPSALLRSVLPHIHQCNWSGSLLRSPLQHKPVH